MLELKRKLVINSENYLRVLEIIKAKTHKARLIGGAVRDAIIGTDSQDIDIATTMHPEEVMKVFSALGYKVIPTGIKFGTVSVLYNNELFEVTTLRQDISFDGRHAKIEYTDDFYLDAIRRDFTINALSYCPFEQKIYDYFGGIKDLESNCVKFIGNAELRIKEDYLRILRFFRFFGKFGKEIDQNSLDSCVKYKSSLKKLSKERIKSELDLILKLPNYFDILILMSNLSILQEVLPISNLRIDQFINAHNITERFATPLTNETKYALIFALEGLVPYSRFIDLKFSRTEARAISNLLSMLQQKNIDEWFLKKIWLENDKFVQVFIFLAVIYKAEKKIEELFLKLKNKHKPIFPIIGNDIISLGITGSAVGTELSHLQKKWIKSDFTLTKQNLIDIVKRKHEK